MQFVTFFWQERKICSFWDTSVLKICRIAHLKPAAHHLYLEFRKLSESIVVIIVRISIFTTLLYHLPKTTPAHLETWTNTPCKNAPFTPTWDYPRIVVNIDESGQSRCWMPSIQYSGTKFGGTFEFLRKLLRILNIITKHCFLLLKKNTAL